MDIIAEERERNDEAIEEIRKNIEERDTFYTEEIQRKEEEIQELRRSIIKQEEVSAETRKEVAAVWGKVAEMENKKRRWWRIFG
jgi:hypothetical protein